MQSISTSIWVPDHPFDPRYRRTHADVLWWDRHIDASVAWLEEAYPRCDADRELAMVALDVLLAVPILRRGANPPGPRHSWEGISAYEILFCRLGHIDLDGIHPILLGERIQEAAACLARAGLIDQEIHARLDEELTLWIPRFHAWKTRRTWYCADGSVGQAPRPLPKWRYRKKRKKAS